MKLGGVSVVRSLLLIRYYVSKLDPCLVLVVVYLIVVIPLHKTSIIYMGKARDETTRQFQHECGMRNPPTLQSIQYQILGRFMISVHSSRTTSLSDMTEIGNIGPNICRDSTFCIYCDYILFGGKNFAKNRNEYSKSKLYIGFIFEIS